MEAWDNLVGDKFCLQNQKYKATDEIRINIADSQLLIN